MKSAPLPPEFAALQGQVHYVQQVSRTEFCSSCPHCGGELHPNSELPDRFRMFLTGKVRGWCRRCSFLWWPDMADNYEPPTPQELEAWRQKQEAAEEARLRSAQTALANLRDNRIWEQYHKMLDDRARQYWRGRGIPDAYQNYWALGWDHQRDAATIPLFGPAWEPLNVKLRLMDDSKGRYRYLLSGQPAPMFLADPDISLENHVIAIEGELKAATSYIVLDDPAACIVGLPGLSPSQSITDTLSKAERVTLVLDPGSDVRNENGWSQAGKLIKAIGRDKCRLLIPNAKIDDALLAAKLDKYAVQRLFAQAVML